MRKGQKIVTEEVQVTRHSPLLAWAGKKLIEAGNFCMTTEETVIQTERRVISADSE